MSSGTSYNGWPANSDKDAIGVVSSDVFPGGVKSGDVTTVLGYVMRQLSARVEPVVDGWCWGYTYKANVNNPSQLSCHASGTAGDFNAPDHPNGSSGTFTQAQRGQIYAILDEVQGSVSWLEGYDEMHFEICVSAADLAVVAATLPDGGGAPTPTPPEPTSSEDDGMTASVQVNGSLNVFAIAEDHRIHQQWPDPGSPSGWSGWVAGVPGEWRGGLSVTAGSDGGFSLFGVDTEGRVCQVWSTPDGWQGPVPFDGITAL